MGSRWISIACITLMLTTLVFTGSACSKSTPEQSAADAVAATAIDPALADALPWDAERMTELTAELATAMREVRNAFRKNPIMQAPDGPKRRTANQMMDVLRGLDRHCSALASRVSNGENAEQTLNLARRIGTGLRDANMLGRRLMTNAWADERILPAMNLINKIAPYYGRAPLYDTETMTMIGVGPNPNRRQQDEAPSDEAPSE